MEFFTAEDDLIEDTRQFSDFVLIMDWGLDAQVSLGCDMDGVDQRIYRFGNDTGEGVRDWEPGHDKRYAYP